VVIRMIFILMNDFKTIATIGVAISFFSLKALLIRFLNFKELIYSFIFMASFRIRRLSL
jgi:hypothetical protein